MKTETPIQTVNTKSATATLVRSVDLDALAAEYNDAGAIPLAAMQGAGAFECIVQSKARGAEPVRVEVASEAEGLGFLDGFACASAGAFKPARKPRKEKAKAEPKPASKPKQNGKTGTKPATA